MAGEEAPLIQPGTSSLAEMELLRQRAEVRRLRRPKPVEAKMSMTPMIDIVFLLIFFFMVVTDMSNMEIESVALPFALEAEPDGTGKRFIVSITDRGKIRIMRRTVSPDMLLQVLQKKVTESGRDQDGLPTVAVKIRADAKTEYKHIQEVMVKCMRAYIWKLSFGVRPAADEDALLRTLSEKGRDL
ncbi:MAG: ExbD/TolR family protein [Planctomycetota bacterium]|jgi:biopolymer transport protein ExbD